MILWTAGTTRPVGLYVFSIAAPLAGVVLSVFLSCSGGRSTGPVGETPETITVGPDGGTFQFASGISLEVPAGAVATSQSIAIHLLDSAYADSMVSMTGIARKKLVAAFAAEPSGLEFDTAVTVTIPVGRRSFLGIPIHYVLDTANRSCSVVATDLTYDAAAGAVSIKLKSFSPHAVAEVEGALSRQVCDQTDTCRCGSIHVEETSQENVSENGSCQVVQVDGYVEYLSCPGQPRETWTFYESSSGCVPQVTVSAPATVNKGGAAAVNVSVSFGGQPVEARSVSLSSTPNGSIAPTSGATTGGSLGATFTAGDAEGVATVTATAVVDYWNKVIVANGQVIDSVTRTARVTRTANIRIATDSVQTYHLSLDVTGDSVTFDVIGNDYIFFTVGHYTAHLEFNVYREREDTVEWLTYDTVGTGTQTIGQVEAHCTSTDYSNVVVEQVDAPATFGFSPYSLCERLRNGSDTCCFGVDMVCVGDPMVDVTCTPYADVRVGYDYTGTTTHSAVRNCINGFQQWDGAAEIQFQVPLRDGAVITGTTCVSTQTVGPCVPMSFVLRVTRM
jgi:hypothetical protein